MDKARGSAIGAGWDLWGWVHQDYLDVVNWGWQVREDGYGWILGVGNRFAATISVEGTFRQAGWLGDEPARSGTPHRLTRVCMPMYLQS